MPPHLSVGLLEKEAVMRVFLYKCYIFVLALILSTSLYAYPVFPYITIGGGYGNYRIVNANDGATGFFRLGLGADFTVNKHVTLGAETAIQNGNRMRLSAVTTAVLGPDSMPVFITVRPPIDILLTTGYRFADQFSVLGKIGVAYLNVMVDTVTIPNVSQTMPELQLGIRWHATKKINLDVNYQHYFGPQPKLTDVNQEQGTANLTNLPTWNAILVAIEYGLLE